MSAFYSECSLFRPPGEPILCRRWQDKNGTSEMHQLNICTFKGIQNLPLYVARQQNFFAQQGLHIDINYTTGSIPQLAGLVREEYQLIQTAPDNVINVDNNPIAFGLDHATAPHVIMLLGGSVGPLSIYAQRDITKFDHLRGSVLGVDNPTSGFALVSEIFSGEMDCYWGVTTPLPLQEVRATVLMRSKEVLLQQLYSMPPLTCKQIGQVLTSSLPQLTTTPLMPLLLPLAFRPGSSNILTKLPATLLPTLKHCAGYMILRMLLMCRPL